MCIFLTSQIGGLVKKYDIFIFDPRGNPALIIFKRLLKINVLSISCENTLNQM